jgi:flagellar capping protein FliD
MEFLKDKVNKLGEQLNQLVSFKLVYKNEMTKLNDTIKDLTNKVTDLNTRLSVLEDIRKPHLTTKGSVY